MPGLSSPQPGLRPRGVVLSTPGPCGARDGYVPWGTWGPLVLLVPADGQSGPPPMVLGGGVVGHGSGGFGEVFPSTWREGIHVLPGQGGCGLGIGAGERVTVR